jgi:hypothetical protein
MIYLLLPVISAVLLRDNDDENFDLDIDISELQSMRANLTYEEKPAKPPTRMELLEKDDFAFNSLM